MSASESLATSTSTPAAPRIDARGITLNYGSRRILQNVDLSVGAGELVALLGASGSGKSTLLRIIAGLLRAGSGQVHIDGDLLDGPRADVALAFQDPCLLPWLSVERNAGFGLRFSRQPALSRKARRARVDAALAEVGLAHAHGYMPRQLSGGMAQRTALARCLARRPRTLLLDEPFGALDEVTRGGMQDLLRQLVRDTGAATLLVTHDIDEALRVADRIVLLGAHGRVLAQWQVNLDWPREAHLQALGLLRIEIMQALQDSIAPAATLLASPQR
ncbi:MAG: ABC transporter ATP-binding protein [Janthinobacterium lividum]